MPRIDLACFLLSANWKWNVIYSARSNRTPSNITKYCACHKNTSPKYERNCVKTAEMSCTVCGRSTMIRAWSENGRPWTHQSATRHTTEVTFRAYHALFARKNTTFRAPAAIPDFTKGCTCHEKWHLPNNAPATKSDTRTGTALKIAPATKNDSHDWPLSPIRGATGPTLQRHQILRFLAFYSTILWLYYSFTLLFLVSSILWLR